VQSDHRLQRATLAGKDVKVADIGGKYDLGLPPFTKESELILYFLETSH
jgi:hypothetical protein